MADPNISNLTSSKPLTCNSSWTVSPGKDNCWRAWPTSTQPSACTSKLAIHGENCAILPTDNGESDHEFDSLKNERSDVSLNVSDFPSKDYNNVKRKLEVGSESNFYKCSEQCGTLDKLVGCLNKEDSEVSSEPPPKRWQYGNSEDIDESGYSLPTDTDRIIKFNEAELSVAKGEPRRQVHLKKLRHELLDVRRFNLTNSQRQLWGNNPHLRQALAHRRPVEVRTHSLDWPDRIVVPGSTPTSKYARRHGEAKTVGHWGQRKLLLCELEFFLRYCIDDLAEVQTVLYAGAAPGIHVNYLTSLFPQLRFHLIDPTEFQVLPNDHITVERAYFSDDHATAWKGKVHFFLSDIRDVNVGTMTNKQMDEQVLREMKQQENWVKLMEPKASMLKFRLPYIPGTTEYLDGYVHFQAWAGPTSSEGRLVVTRKDHWDPTTKQFRIRGIADDPEGLKAAVIRLSREISQECSIIRRSLLCEWDEESEEQ